MPDEQLKSTSKKLHSSLSFRGPLRTGIEVVKGTWIRTKMMNDEKRFMTCIPNYMCTSVQRERVGIHSLTARVVNQKKTVCRTIIPPVNQKRHETNMIQTSTAQMHILHL